MKTLSALLQSRKVWIGLVTVLAIATATLLRALDKIPADALLPTISGICLTGGTLIGSIAWEDTATKRTRALTAIVKKLPASSCDSGEPSTTPSEPGSPASPEDNDDA